MDNIFTNLDGGVTEVAREEDVKKAEKKAKMREQIEEMKNAFKEISMNDPDFDKKWHSLSNSIEVVNTLGFGEGGNLLYDKEQSEAQGDRVLVQTSKIVGYRIRNIGDTPITYLTEVWHKNENGEWESTKTEKVLAPGETADLTRKYMTILCSRPEIFFELANGKIVRGPGAATAKTLDEKLEAHYFKFTKGEDGEVKQVNDDAVKLNVGMKIGDEWVVKPEYEETFGFLNIKKVEREKVRRKTKKITSQDLAAAKMFKEIQEYGL